eukprot:988154-Karenia_brevis.AAC.1
MGTTMKGNISRVEWFTCLLILVGSKILGRPFTSLAFEPFHDIDRAVDNIVGRKMFATQTQKAVDAFKSGII